MYRLWVRMKDYYGEIDIESTYWIDALFMLTP